MGLVFCDSRQQRGKHNHVNEWFNEHGVQAVTMKLETGDYSAPGSNILIDTKKDVQEVAGNVGRDHDRFVRELDRAADAGYRLVVLIEEHPEYQSRRERLYQWRPFACWACRKCDPAKDRCSRYRFKPMQGSTVAKIIAKLEKDHGARFEFCSKRDTARRICELLGVSYGDKES